MPDSAPVRKNQLDKDLRGWLATNRDIVTVIKKPVGIVQPRPSQIVQPKEKPPEPEEEEDDGEEGGVEGGVAGGVVGVVWANTVAE